MKKTQIFNFLALLLLFISAGLYAQVSQPFACNQTIYQSIGNATDTTLYNVDTSNLANLSYSAIGSSAGFGYNAIGFNTQDGYVYGIKTASSNELIKIDSNGSYQNLGPVTNLPVGFYAAGEMDTSGNLYVKASGNNNILYKININTKTATAITLSQSFPTPDFAYSTTTKLLYGVVYSGVTHPDNGKLYSINPVNGAVTLIGNNLTPSNFGGMVGAAGEIYGFLNTGGFYKFNLTNGNRVKVSDSPSANNNDAAHCPTSPIIPFEADLSVTKTDGAVGYIPGSTTTYTITVKNNGPSGVMNASVSDPVPAGISAGNVSYTAVASAGSNTNVTGTKTGAINDYVSIPKDGTVTYTVIVNIPATFTGDLVNTVTVTPPANTNDSNTANNFATDTDIKNSSFTCNTNFYLTQYGSAATDKTILYTLDNTTNPFTKTVIGESPAGMHVNGIGYNTVDNFLYGISNDGTANPNPNHLIRIDAAGIFTDLGTISGLPGVGYNNGTLDDGNNLYTTRYGTNAMYRINVMTKIATAITLSRTISVNDLVYDKTVGKLFGYEGTTGTNRLISIDPATGTVTNIGISGLPDGTLIGALFIDVNGDIFGNADNGSGFYQFDRTTGKAVKISNTISAFGNDGANCPDVAITFPADLSITKTDGKTTYIPGSATTYTIVVSNNSGVYGVLGAIVSDPVPTGISAANVSYSVPVLTGGATTSITGPQTGALNDVVGLPIGGTITYTVTVNVPLAFTGNLTNTVTVTPPVNSTDPDMSNNTATDTDTASVCFRDPVTAGTAADTKMGITLLKRAGTGNSDNWPMVRKGGHIALESNTQGFVVTRIAKADLGNITAPQEGMMVYDTTDKCLKIYSYSAWQCFSKPACP